MKSVGVYLLSCLLVLGCKPPYVPPVIEICISNGDGTFECTDERLEESARQYQREGGLNYICTSPKDYDSLYNYCSGLRKKLIESENRHCN